MLYNIKIQLYLDSMKNEAFFERSLSEAYARAAKDDSILSKEVLCDVDGIFVKRRHWSAIDDRGPIDSITNYLLFRPEMSE